MLVSIHALSATGGHCDDQNGMRAGLFGPENGIEKGVIEHGAFLDDVRRRHRP